MKTAINQKSGVFAHSNLTSCLKKILLEKNNMQDVKTDHKETQSGRLMNPDFSC